MNSPTQFKHKMLNEKRLNKILELATKVEAYLNADFISKVDTLESVRKLEDYLNSLKIKT